MTKKQFSRCSLLDSPALAAPRIRGTKFSKKRKKQVLTAFLKGTGNSQLLSLSPSSLLDALVLSSPIALPLWTVEDKAGKQQWPSVCAQDAIKAERKQRALSCCERCPCGGVISGRAWDSGPTDVCKTRLCQWLLMEPRVGNEASWSLRHLLSKTKMIMPTRKQLKAFRVGAFKMPGNGWPFSYGWCSF